MADAEAIYQAQQDAAFQALAGQPAPTTGPAPQPGTPPAQPAKPAAAFQPPRGPFQDLSNEPIIYGVRHGVATFGLGAQGVINGLSRMTNAGYDEKVQGARDVVMGLVQMGFAPFSMPAASIAKTIQQDHPALAASQMDVLDPQFVGFLRTMMGEVVPKVSDEAYGTMTAAEQQAYKAARAGVNRPFTFAEALETAITLAGPIVAAGAMVKGKKPAEPAAKATEAAPVLADQAASAAATAKQATAAAETAVGKVEALAKPKTATEMQLEMQQPTPEQAQAFVDRVQTEQTPTVPLEGAQGPRMFGVNWQRLGAEETVNRVVLDVNRELAGEGRMPATEGAITPTTAADIAARAKTLGVTLDDVMRLPDLPARVKSIEDLDAFTAGVRGVRDAVAGRLTAEAEMALKGEPTSRENIPVLIAMARQAALADKLTGENVAQALGARRAMSDAGVAGTAPSAIMDLVQRIQGMTDIDKAAEMITAVKRQQTPSVMRRFVQNIGEAAARGKDILWEVWVNDLLGPVTAGAKALGDTLMLAKQPGQLTLARWNQKVFPFLFRDLPPGEAIAPWEGAKFAAAAAQEVPTAVMQAIRGVKAGEVDIYTAIGENRAYPGKLAVDVTGRPWQATDAPAYLVNTIGAMIRAPGTTLGIITKAAKAANYAGSTAGYAMRQALAEGLEGPELAQRVKYISEHSPEFPYIAEAAMQVAANNTFTTELGPFGQALTETLNRAHLRSQAPFLRVPINLEKTGAQAMFPFNVPSMLYGDLRRDFDAGGSRRAMAMANVQAGAAFAALIAYLTANRIVTGYGARDPALAEARRLAGEPVHSIIVPDGIPVIGGKAFDYNRIKPVGTMIGLTATATEAWAQLPNDSDSVDRMGQVALIHALAWGRVIQDASYFTGIKEVTDAISANDATVATAAQQFLVSSARSLTPNTYVRTPNRLYFDTTMRDVHTVTDAFLVGIPGYSQDFPPHREMLHGQPMEYPAAFGPAILSPLTYRETEADPVAKMIADNEISALKALPWVAPATGTAAKLFRLKDPSMPDEGIPLTGNQRDRWAVLMTQDVRMGGRTMADELAFLMTQPSFQNASNGPNGAKADIVHNVVNTYRGAALERLLQEDLDLKATVAARQRARIEGKWLPTTNPRSPQFNQPAPGASSSSGLESLLGTLGR